MRGTMRRNWEREMGELGFERRERGKTHSFREEKFGGLFEFLE